MDDFSKYEPDIAQPFKQNFVTRFWYTGGRVIARQGPSDPQPVYESMSDLPDLNMCVTEKVMNESSFRVAIDNYRGMVMRRRHQFYEDMHKDLGYLNHEMAETLDQKVLNLVESTSDYRAIYDMTCSLVDLIR